jgi:predicted hotdog family 3-hydroxylacyl-ACP dehydratase
MIFPNPTSGNFTIGNVAGYEKIEIVNALGQSVKTIKNPTNIVNVSLKGYNGLYLVNLIAADGEKLTRRVILK